jgi:translation initiation factor IF-2
MYNYKLIREDEDKAKLKFQEERVNVFNEIENELQSLIKPLRQAKIETIKYYRENPNSYAVVTGTDLIKDFIKDIKILLEK